MYRLRRFYLDSIGVPDNRFSDLLVDLTDADGAPADSIVWLRNGAGKTTMLSLLLALILPDRRDFLATRTKKRTLEDLVQSHDTAHVVAEWADSEGRVLLTGAIYEWDGRQRPRDYNAAGKENLKRTWWCVHPEPAVEGSALDDLPFTFRTSGRCDRDGFRRHLNELAAHGVNVVVASSTIAEWHQALRERRFDPDLFRYFTEVNATEGGIEALFDGIDSPGAFVRYLLRFVSDRNRTAPVRDLLSETQKEIAKQPGYEAEREFCAEAQPKVGALGEAHRKVVAATAARDEERARVAGFKKALLDKADGATALQRLERERQEHLDDRFKEKRAEADAARRQRDEYTRLAAVFRVRTARDQVSDATERAGALALDVAAWEAVADRAALDEAIAALSVRQGALAAAAEEAQPLIELFEAAQAEWAGALEAAAEGARLRLASLASAVTAARREKEAAERARRTAHERYVELASELRELTERVNRFQATRAAAVEKGTLEPSERLEAAVERYRHRLRVCTADLERLVGERESLARDLVSADDRCESARQERQRAGAVHDRLQAELTNLEERAAQIGDDARLRQLLQADSVDLTESAADAVALLTGSVAGIEAEILGVRTGLVQDENAVEGLRADGFLPPRPAVEAVLSELRAAGVTAFSGWSYLANHVPAEEQRRKITELPEVVEGVVIYGDPAEAAERIETTLDDAVVVASARVFQEERTPRVVLGPVAARYDAAAAADEHRRRADRLTAGQDRLERLNRQRDGEAAKIAEIRALVQAFPDDGVTGLRNRLRSAKAASRDAETEESAATSDRDELRGQHAEIVEEHARLRETLPELRVALARVEDLEREEQEVVNPASARMEAIPALQEAEKEAETAAVATYESADVDIERFRDESRGLESSRRTWTATRATLPAHSIFTDKSVESAEAAVAESKELLRRQFPEAELRRAEAEAEKTVRAGAQKWERHASPVRARAAQLSATTVAEDRELRQEALDRVRDAKTATERKLGAAEAELREAETELRTATPRGRTRHTEQVLEPADRGDALRHAAESNELAIGLQLAAGFLERERDDAGRAADDAKGLIGVLLDQANLFRSVDPADVARGIVPDRDDEIRAKTERLVQGFEALESEYNGLLGNRSQHAERLRNWAADDRFAAVAEDENGQAVRRLRELFRSEHLYERVAARAGEFADDLETRQQAITRQLTQVQEHKQNVVSRLGDLVDDALRLLGRASALSELPEGVGPWAGYRFLAVDAKKRPTREQAALRIGELVDRMVGAGKVETDPTELLWRATEAAVTAGFRASVLKPAPDQPTGRTAVEDMRKWSGGENLTASLVLFCVMARLRTEQRTGHRTSSVGGLVPLDNPLGKANYLPFLDLQRRVAKASGVQLVFLTGIGDLGAVTAFPRIAAMHKRPSATRPGRAYVSNDLDNSAAGTSQLVDVVSSVRRDP
ncbi:hypothetical protein [Amycolatopsis albispora]|uniref:Uncharacterized protein n=1 Tax=Amycolatopsis albispora TaxID=1804986 RepID=A0A344L3Q9_9PSEU|nr:hypothetical protein [Amycolatopsis albispora]AXB42683.1 hypothetical protein A4R43_09170 [Amycolatopsis albispora]